MTVKKKLFLAFDLFVDDTSLELHMKCAPRLDGLLHKHGGAGWRLPVSRNLAMCLDKTTIFMVGKPSNFYFTVIIH